LRGGILDHPEGFENGVTVENRLVAAIYRGGHLPGLPGAPQLGYAVAGEAADLRGVNPGGQGGDLLGGEGVGGHR